MLFVPAPALPTRAHIPTPVLSTTTTSPTMTIPKSIRESSILIIGGGPTGSTAAAHCHKRGIRTTLIEKQADFTDFDVTRAYCLRLDFRAGRVLQQVDGMFEHLSRDLQTTYGMLGSTTKAEGKNVKTSVLRLHHGIPDLSDLRPGVVDSLKRFVGTLDVDTHYGVTMTDISVTDDGLITVTLSTPEGEATHTTRLLLACDGRNSRVGKLLEAATSRGEAVHAPYGHGIESFDSPAVGLAVKSIVLDEDIVNDVLGTRDPSSFLVRALHGDPSRGFEDIFGLTIFPAGPEFTKRVGGFVGTVARQQGHALWKVGSVEEGYEMFQANFPQLDVRKAISEKEMRKFVQAQPSTFGDIRRRRSLAVKTGRGKSGGAVVFLGDSAHAFPPDIGQGVCAAIGDVGVFMETLDAAREDEDIVDVVMRYDTVRSDEAKALMKLSVHGQPYQYGVYKFGRMLWMMNFLGRRMLSRKIPGVFWPQIGDMIDEDITYREMVRRGDVTTRRLVGCAVAVGAAVLAVVVQFAG